MSGNRRPIIAWDTCVFLAWFNKEKDKDLDAIAQWIERIENNKVRVVVSAVCKAEIMTIANDEICGATFADFLRRDNVLPVDMDFRIADRSAEFRKLMLEKKAEKACKEGLKIPDAMIAATASIYGAEVLHTFDPVLLKFGELGCAGQMQIGKPEKIDLQKSLFAELSS